MSHFFKSAALVRRCPAAPLLLLLVALNGCAAILHHVGMTLVPPETEIELGRKLSRQIEAEQPVLRDSKIQRWVEEVARPLVLASHRDRPGIRYRFRVLDDPLQVNAFALPGGFIYLYSGLLLFMENEAEVAGVLAHEIGHVVGRHSANQLAARFGVKVISEAVLGEDPKLLAELLANLFEAGGMAAFSRDDEREADRYGVSYAIAAGYDPRGLATFFTKLLEAESGRRRGGFQKLMSTHPATAERIRYVEKRIARAGDPGAASKPSVSSACGSGWSGDTAAAVDDLPACHTFPSHENARRPLRSAAAGTAGREPAGMGLFVFALLTE